MNQAQTTKQSPAPSIEAISMSMKFGDFIALDKASMKIQAGEFHALLGENGAGKSTLVKCLMGFYHATEGQILVNQKEAIIKNPIDAHALNMGMVYQHFTLIPSLTAAENFVISRDDTPSVINWAKESSLIEEFMQSVPFKVPLYIPINQLSAGEKQKLEILKQLYLGRSFLILDEPTSVLTPDEADEVLSLIKQLCKQGQISAMMITHKFREVTRYTDSVSILRKGKLVGSGKVSALTTDEMANMMVGGQLKQSHTSKKETAKHPVLSIKNAHFNDIHTLKTINIENLEVNSGEIVGVAGVSGNGQVELMQLLSGQKQFTQGYIEVKGEHFSAQRKQEKALKVHFLPEEPLFNACSPKMSVAENLAFRNFDEDDQQKPLFWLNQTAINQQAHKLVESFNIKTTSIHSPIEDLSGGNVQRAVLARELSQSVDLLIISNPCFGLDFSAVAEIRARIVKARNNGSAILLISEDLDEIIELSDTILVMSEGRFIYQTDSQSINLDTIGQHMAGHH